MTSTKKPEKRQLGILREITLLLVAVFVAFGLIAYFVIRASENRLIDKSVEKLKQTEAENISSSYRYLMDLLAPQLEEEGIRAGSLQDIMRSVLNREISGIQDFVSEELSRMVDSGLLGLSLNIFIFEDFPGLDEPFVFASSDPSLVSRWEVPEYLRQAIRTGRPYLWMEGGIPELGLEGEHLIVVVQRDLPRYGLRTGFAGIKDMRGKVAAINDFYRQEQRSTDLILLLLVLLGIAVISIITFIVLAYLIRIRITEPIEELSRAAEKVMEGDLDVHITVRAGEEFEQLKAAFKSMVEEWGRLMARSLEGGEDRPGPGGGTPPSP